MFFPIPAFRSFRQWMDTSSAFVGHGYVHRGVLAWYARAVCPLPGAWPPSLPARGTGWWLNSGAGTGTVTRQLLDAGIAPGVWLWWSSPRLW